MYTVSAGFFSTGRGFPPVSFNSSSRRVFPVSQQGISRDNIPNPDCGRYPRARFRGPISCQAPSRSTRIASCFFKSSMAFSAFLPGENPTTALVINAAGEESRQSPSQFEIAADSTTGGAQEIGQEK